MKNFRNIIAISLFILLSPNNGYSQLEHIPQLLSATNTGTEFIFAFHPAWEEQSNENYVSIYVFSMFKTNVRLSIPSKNKHETKLTNPGELTEFRLSPSEAMLYSLGNGKNPITGEVANIYFNGAIFINSDEPVSCYAFVHFKGKSEGFMVHPVHTLGLTYQISSFPDHTDNQTLYSPSYTTLVGVYSNTRASFRLSGNLNTSVLADGAIYKQNDIIRRTLNRGDVWIIGGMGKGNDLSGSIVSANKPIAVISGSFCGGSTVNCNYMIEQETPTSAWGNNYFVTPLVGRKKFPLVRIYTTSPDNTIRFDGIEFAKVPKVGGPDGVGFLQVRTGSSEDPRPINISAFYPINVVQYNPAADDDNTPDAPFKMQLVPVEQFKKDIIFSTVAPDNFKYEKNYFNLLYLADENGKIPHDLQINKLGNNPDAWHPVSNYAQPGLPIQGYEIDGRKFYSTNLDLINPGVYRVKSTHPIMIYSYGNSQIHAFGTTATSGLRDLNSFDSLAPIISFQTKSICNISGTARDTAQPGAEPSNLAYFKMLPGFSDNFTFNSPYIVAGLSNNATFELVVKDCFKPANAVLVASDKRGNVSMREITYTPKISLSLTAQDTSLSIIKSGKTRDFHFSLKNESNEPTFELKSIILNNNDPQFELLENIEPGTKIPAKSAHNFRVRFRAHSLYSDALENLEKVFSNSISVLTTEGHKLAFDAKIQIEVTNPRIIADDLNFDSLTVGERSEPKFIKVSNPSKISLLITGFEFDTGAPFELDLPEATQESPFEIDPYGEHLIPIKFAPLAPGEYSSVLKIFSDAYVIKNTAIITAKALPSSVGSSYLYDAISIHPNPATDYIYINFNDLARDDSPAYNSGSGSVKIFNTLGQCVSHLTPTLSKGEGGRIDVSQLPVGVYLMRVGNRVEKFVKV